MPRFDTLPGIGRVRVYDAGPRTIDRYAVLFEDFDVYDGSTTTPVKPWPYGPREALCMSGAPTHPQGFSQWSQARPQFSGRRIPFSSLPENVQRHVIARATED